MLFKKILKMTSLFGLVLFSGQASVTNSSATDHTTDPAQTYYGKLSLSIPLQQTQVRGEEGQLIGYSYSYDVVLDREGNEIPKRQELIREFSSATPYDQQSLDFAPWQINESLSFEQTCSLVLNSPSLHPSIQYPVELMTLAMMAPLHPTNPVIRIRDEFAKQFECEGMLFPSDKAPRHLPLHLFKAPCAGDAVRPWQLIVTGTDGIRLSEFDLVKRLLDQGYHAAVVDFSNAVSESRDQTLHQHVSLKDQISKQSFYGSALSLHCAIEYLRHVPGFDPEKFGLSSFSLGSVVTLLAFDPLILSSMQKVTYPQFFEITDPLAVIMSKEMDPRFAGSKVQVYTAREDQLFGDQAPLLRKRLQMLDGTNWQFSKASRYHDGLASLLDYGRYWTRAVQAVPYAHLSHIVLPTLDEIRDVAEQILHDKKTSPNADDNFMDYLMHHLPLGLFDEKGDASITTTIEPLMKQLMSLKTPTVVVGLDKNSKRLRGEMISKLIDSLEELAPAILDDIFPSTSIGSASTDSDPLTVLPHLAGDPIARTINSTAVDKDEDVTPSETQAVATPVANPKNTDQPLSIAIEISPSTTITPSTNSDSVPVLSLPTGGDPIAGTSDSTAVAGDITATETQTVTTPVVDHTNTDQPLSTAVEILPSTTIGTPSTDSDPLPLSSLPTGGDPVAGTSDSTAVAGDITATETQTVTTPVVDQTNTLVEPVGVGE